eukprot:s308_g5.t2
MLVLTCPPAYATDSTFRSWTVIDESYPTTRAYHRFPKQFGHGHVEMLLKKRRVSKPVEPPSPEPVIADPVICVDDLEETPPSPGTVSIPQAQLPQIKLPKAKQAVKQAVPKNAPAQPGGPQGEQAEPKQPAKEPEEPSKPGPPGPPGPAKDADAKHAAMAAVTAKRKAPSEMPAMDTRRSSLAGLVKLLGEAAPQVPAPTREPPASNSRNSSLARFFGEAEIFPDEGPPAVRVDDANAAAAAQAPMAPITSGGTSVQGSATLKELLSLVAKSPQAAQNADSDDGPKWQAAKRAQLLCLELQDFKSFKRKKINLEGESVRCLVGCNSSGKSAILDALRFLLGRRCDRGLRSFIRRGKRDAATYARVTAKFRVERPGNGQGTVTLMREVREHPDSADKEAYITSNWVSQEAEELVEISEAGYQAWLSQALQASDGDLLVPQFGLMDSRSATVLLAMIPAELEKVGAAIQASGPLLKRKSAKTARTAPGVQAGVLRAEAWLSRRVDEIYRQLTREPVDEKLEEWGEGGQALLQRQPDGSFDLLTSMRRGAAACGYGTPLKSLSDGARDICALSLLFALPGFMNGMQDALPPFMVLDEPDSRLDKRHASALRHFLQGPDGPKQCLWMSLNNHSAFSEDSVLEEDEADACESALPENLELLQGAEEAPKSTPDGVTSSNRDLIKVRFLSKMSARIREAKGTACPEPSAMSPMHKHPRAMVDPSVHAFFDEHLRRSANQTCCDGGGVAPCWASVSHGTYISIEASGIHRSLGVATSFVQSLYLDAWKPVHLKMMELGGNERFQKFMEAQGVPEDMPIREKYSTRAAKWYREATWQILTRCLSWNAGLLLLLWGSGGPPKSKESFAESRCGLESPTPDIDHEKFCLKALLSDGAATVLRCECLSHERHIVFEELLVALLHEENEADMDDEEQPEML